MQSESQKDDNVKLEINCKSALRVPQTLIFPITAMLLFMGYANMAYSATVYHYLNSLTDYSGGQGPGFGPDTKVPNWVARFASKARKTYKVDGEFGFIDGWTLPPRSTVGYKDARSANIGESWRTADSANVTHLYFTPDNFGQASSSGPKEGVFNGDSYVNRLLNFIDEWGAKTDDKISYRIYEGWADMGNYADPFPGNTKDLKRWMEYTLGDYHDWYLTLLSELKSERPELDIKLVPVSKAIVGAMDQTILRELSSEDLFVDNAPHGNATFYFLAGVVTYMDLYQEPIPSGYKIPSSVNQLVRDNFSEVESYLMQIVLQ